MRLIGRLSRFSRIMMASNLYAKKCNAMDKKPRQNTFLVLERQSNSDKATQTSTPWKVCFSSGRTWYMYKIILLFIRLLIVFWTLTASLLLFELFFSLLFLIMWDSPGYRIPWSAQSYCCSESSQYRYQQLLEDPTFFNYMSLDFIAWNLT